MDTSLRPHTIRIASFLVLVLSIFSPVSESNQFCETGIGYGDLECGITSSSSSKILIKGGTVVNAHHLEIADVYIEAGIIAAVKSNIKVGDDVTVLDATGKFVMPGIAVIITAVHCLRQSKQKKGPHFSESVIMVQVVPLGHLDLLTEFSLRGAHLLIFGEVMMTSHGRWGRPTWASMSYVSRCLYIEDCFAEINKRH
ncbi:pyrimidine 2 [Actinidia rufa]|uniref:Pyrimidine 2 n=1 Tax=Actinidia rufa TaxID=165716 RepID=A0A7J0HCA4_9ERIC|nr:pyrimidine 2 [Actinidia rufa]